MNTVLESLNAALFQAMKDNPDVILVGEDILDPYGGAFKVTRGLSTAYPQRVLAAPISEAAMIGVAAGLALQGMKPVVEIMFGDFLTLAADQIINQLSKLRWMYNNQVRVPVVIRTPMGGRRGYGPTHSQTLEKLYLGTPGLCVVAPFHFAGESELGSPGELLYHAVLKQDDPLLFVENKLQYLLPLLKDESLQEFEVKIETSSLNYPVYILAVRTAPPPKLTLAAYGYMAELARQAVLKLAYEAEVFCELVVLTQLAPFELDAVFSSVQKTGRLLVVEEGTAALGWGAEVAAQAAEKLGRRLSCLRRLAAWDVPVPASPALEQKVLPGVEDIFKAARKTLL